MREKSESAAASSGLTGVESALKGKSSPAKTTQPVFVAGNKGVEVDEDPVQLFRGSSFVLEGMIESVSPGNEMSLRAVKLFIETSNLSGRTVFDTEKRESLLEIATDSNQPAVMELLLDKGADVNYSNAEGKTALDVAREKKQYECMKMLEKHGAKLTGDDTRNINEWERRSGQSQTSAQTPAARVITQAPSRPAQAPPQPQQQLVEAMLGNNLSEVDSLLKAHSKVIDITGIDAATKKSPFIATLSD